MKPLREKQSWMLFFETCGKIHPEVEQYAKQLVRNVKVNHLV